MFQVHLYISMCNFVNSLVAEVGPNQTSYSVAENAGQLGFWINITSGQKAPGQECLITVETVDGSAQGKPYFIPCKSRYYNH